MTTTTRDVQLHDPVRYQFHDAARTGVWLGLGTGAVVTTGAGLLVSILLLAARTPAPLAAVPVGGCLLLSTARFAGRPLLQWTRPVAGHATSNLTGARRWCGPLPAAPTETAPNQRRHLPVPPECGRLRLLSCPGDADIGLILDNPARTVTAVFDVAGIDRFPLLDTEERDALVTGWGQALSILADTDDALLRLQVVDRASTTPIQHESSGRTDAADEALSRTLETLAVARESRLALQWTFPRIDDTALATLAARCRGVSRCLLTARLVSRPLPAGDLSTDVTTALTDALRQGRPGSAPAPLSRHTAWTHVRIDDTVHRCFAVTDWPRTPVTCDWLAPLLLAAPAGVGRTVAVHLHRVSPATAQRIARTARANAILDQRDRLRLGMTSSATLDRAEAAGVAMDEELAAGHRTHRITAVVALRAATTTALDDATRTLRQAAAAARLEIRPLHGQHDRALAATLPLCRVRPRGAQ